MSERLPHGAPMTDPDRLPGDLEAARSHLPEVKAARAHSPERYPADFDWAVEVLEEAWDEIERLQRRENRNHE